MPDMPLRREIRLHVQNGRRDMVFVVMAALLVFVVIGLVYNSIFILRVPQSGLKLFEIVWVSFTACVVFILLATAIAAVLEALGKWLTPKPPSEQWLREEVRHHRLAGMEVLSSGKDLRAQPARGNAGAVWS